MKQKKPHKPAAASSDHRSKTVLAAVCAFAAPAFILWAIYRFGVAVPYLDQWELVPYLEKMHNHTLSISAVWQQHNEHRIFFPRALMLFMARLTGWDIRYEFAASFVFACLTLLLLCSMLRRSFGNRPPKWLFVAASLLVFSAAQHENWLWGCRYR